MRTFILKSLMVGAVVLLSHPALAQEDSVKGIMKDLSEKPASEKSAPEKVAVAVDPEPVAMKMNPTREPGFLGRYVQEVSTERARRITEEGALDDVRKAWNGMILRDYLLTADAKRSLDLLLADAVTDARGKFPEVSFAGKEAYAIYRPQLNRLFVLNTPAQIQKLEAVLASLEEAAPNGFEQVEIEARFVEFEEGALEELGFNWSDVLDGESVFEDDKWAINDGENLFTDALRTVPFAQTGNLGSPLNESAATGEWTVSRLEDMFNGSLSGTGATDINISGKIGSNAIDLLIRALDQTAGVDVLSAPRIVTMSGKKATIRVGQRHYYPDVYEEGVSEGTVLHVRYEDFGEKLLGVEMAVTPKIKGNEIQLEMNPKIIDLIGWERFELAPANSSYTYYQYRVGMQFEHEPVVARLPVFKERQIKTEVTVQDGSTVGMGGLISEKLEAFEDRVPVLGSIPLIGRLFRSEGERSVKRNLMIFVTAKKVQPNGTIFPEQKF